MNVITDKILGLLFLFLLIPSVVYSFNVCNVDINEPWFMINDSNGKSILIIDNEGDIYLEGQDHSFDNKNSLESFIVGDMFFNNVTSNFTNIFEDVSNLVMQDNSFIVKDTDGNIVTILNKTSIITKGNGAFEGSQGNCLSDGGYCQGNNLEIRDYFCDLNDSKSGSCSYSVTGNIDCSTVSSIDSDGGINYTQKGSVVDFNGCSGTGCLNITYTDYCQDSSTLVEFSPFLSSYSQVSYNCNNYEEYYCSGTDVYTTNFDCGEGQCSQGADSFVQSCTVNPTSYSSWTCDGFSTKVRVRTDYSPTCTNGLCGQTSTSTDERINCNVGTHCSGGSCLTDTYSWVVTSWSSCSASCGYGSQTPLNYYCKRDHDGLVVSNSYCGSAPSSQSCYAGPCCTSQSYSACYGGDVWWYNSCGSRENVKEYCSTGCATIGGSAVCTNTNYAYRCYSSYIGPRGDDHMSSPYSNCEVPSMGYYREATYKPFSTQYDNTAALYRCYDPLDGDHKVFKNGCGGYTFEAILGYAFNSYNSNAGATTPLYSCWYINNEGNIDYFVTKDSGCEGKYTRYLLGYVNNFY